MFGKVDDLKYYPDSSNAYGGMIRTSNNERYFFHKTSVIDSPMFQLTIGTEVEFSLGKNPKNHQTVAINVKIKSTKEEASVSITQVNNPSGSKVETAAFVNASPTNKVPSSPNVVSSSIAKPFEFYRPGFSKNLDIEQCQRTHLHTDSKEMEILQKLSKVFLINYISHHDAGHNNVFPFCILGATPLTQQFIRGKYEFLLVFSYFHNQDFQQKTIRVAQGIRRRKEITDRRAMVNFFILVSNARKLKEEIDRIKGGTDAAVIPFSFEEILSCPDDVLSSLIVERFSEYYFENNMLGASTPIEEDTLLFGDRGKIADAIVQRCIEGSFSGIFGLRRSGKSSVLRAVMRRLDNNNIKYYAIEARSGLETINSWKQGLYQIAREIRRITLGVEQQENETRSAFVSRLNLNSTEDDYEKNAAGYFVEDVHLYTKGLDTFVIAIDEVEVITYNTASSDTWKSLEAYKGFWGALRDSGCALIISGVNSTINEKSTINFNGSTCDNPMYERIHNCADFSKTYLPVFSDDQTKAMINTLGQYSNVAFDFVYPDINRAFGGQPYPIRQFCAYMFDRIKALRKPNEVYQFSKATVEALLSDFCNSDKGIQMFNTILQHVSIYAEEYQLLTAFALTPEKYRSITPEKATLISHLEQYGLIEFDRTTSFASFSIQSLGEYIRKIADKKPEDMTNDERRHYIQDKVCECEIKLKTYIRQYYFLTGQSTGRSTLSQYVKPKPGKQPAPNAQSCPFDDLFKHSVFILYFSDLKKIIKDKWSTLGSAIQSFGLNKERFVIYMEDLNAGRTDADHYDPEDKTCPDTWDIDDRTMSTFMTAYGKLSEFFDSCNL